MARALLVHNKCDLSASTDGRPVGIRTSTVRGDGVGDLLEAIAGRLVPDAPPPGAAVPFTDEQGAAVRRLAIELANRERISIRVTPMSHNFPILAKMWPDFRPFFRLKGRLPHLLFQSNRGKDANFHLDAVWPEWINSHVQYCRDSPACKAEFKEERAMRCIRL